MKAKSGVECIGRRGADGARERKEIRNSSSIIRVITFPCQCKNKLCFDDIVIFVLVIQKGDVTPIKVKLLS